MIIIIILPAGRACLSMLSSAEQLVKMVLPN